MEITKEKRKRERILEITKERKKERKKERIMGIKKNRTENNYRNKERKKELWTWRKLEHKIISEMERKLALLRYISWDSKLVRNKKKKWKKKKYKDEKNSDISFYTKYENISSALDSIFSRIKVVNFFCVIGIISLCQDQRYKFLRNKPLLNLHNISCF